MKKKILSHSRKKSTVRVAKSKKAWHKLLPLKFSFLSITILGCVALILGGVYYFLPQQNPAVLALSTGAGGGSGKTFQIYWSISSNLPNMYNVTLLTNVRSNAYSSTFSCKTPWWSQRCDFQKTFTVNTNTTYYITPSLYYYNSKHIKLAQKPRTITIKVCQPNWVACHDHSIRPGASYIYRPSAKDGMLLIEYFK